MRSDQATRQFHGRWDVFARVLTLAITALTTHWVRQETHSCDFTQKPGLNTSIDVSERPGLALTPCPVRSGRQKAACPAGIETVSP